MNKQMKNFMLVGMVALLLAACGRFEPAPAPVDGPDFAVTERPTSLPEPVDTEEPVEDAPTVVSSDGADSEQFSKYKGLVYPPSPEDLTQGFSMLIQDREGYSLMLVLDGANKMLWLSKVAQDDASGNPLWEVKDVLGLSDLEAGLTLIPDGCVLNGTPDSEILAAGRNGVIVLAWRANTTLDQFESIPVSGIQCSSDKAMPLD